MITEPTIRLAGQKQYTLQAGESVSTNVAGDFRKLFTKAVASADPNKPITVQLMFEVSQ